MTYHYYVVYCAKTDAGMATGRTFISRGAKIETASDIEATESIVLENARKKTPSMSSLFLTFWTEIRDSELPLPHSP